MFSLVIILVELELEGVFDGVMDDVPVAVDMLRNWVLRGVMYLCIHPFTSI